MKRLTLAALALLTTGTAAPACELATMKIVFPNKLGTHTAWYCKATDLEKKRAIELAKQYACLPDKLKAHGKPVVVEEAHDMIPYWFTKADAEKSGPLLDVRLVLEEKKIKIDDETEETERMGLKVLATGVKTPVLLPQPTKAPFYTIDFDITEPERFIRECPDTGCNERYFYLCGNPPQQ